ncbi:hypothetical protein AMATHDRAFT_6174 [Amanita thiersii Skay4041]|uniref:Uncharacterized protein n=1 Tax=Amanita thiersii Skay4041 TaxID=703135 RepID=A0A2A9NBP3_9AGAR|nr:hypothetical protein AMATHDRAFT_6174 [Amanita thiersii Skay4041]
MAPGDFLKPANFFIRRSQITGEAIGSPASSPKEWRRTVQFRPWTNVIHDSESPSRRGASSDARAAAQNNSKPYSRMGILARKKALRVRDLISAVVEGDDYIPTSIQLPGLLSKNKLSRYVADNIVKKSDRVRKSKDRAKSSIRGSAMNWMEIKQVEEKAAKQIAREEGTELPADIASEQSVPMTKKEVLDVKESYGDKWTSGDTDVEDETNDDNKKCDDKCGLPDYESDGEQDPLNKFLADLDKRLSLYEQDELGKGKEEENAIEQPTNPITTPSSPSAVRPSLNPLRPQSAPALPPQPQPQTQTQTQYPAMETAIDNIKHWNPLDATKYVPSSQDMKQGGPVVPPKPHVSMFASDAQLSSICVDQDVDIRAATSVAQEPCQPSDMIVEDTNFYPPETPMVLDPVPELTFHPTAFYDADVRMSPEPMPQHATAFTSALSAPVGPPVGFLFQEPSYISPLNVYQQNQHTYIPLDNVFQQPTLYASLSTISLLPHEFCLPSSLETAVAPGAFQSIPQIRPIPPPLTHLTQPTGMAGWNETVHIPPPQVIPPPSAKKSSLLFGPEGVDFWVRRRDPPIVEETQPQRPQESQEVKKHEAEKTDEENAAKEVKTEGREIAKEEDKQADTANKGEQRHKQLNASGATCIQSMPKCCHFDPNPHTSWSSLTVPVKKAPKRKMGYSLRDLESDEEDEVEDNSKDEVKEKVKRQSKETTMKQKKAKVKKAEANEKGRNLGPPKKKRRFVGELNVAARKPEMEGYLFKSTIEEPETWDDPIPVLCSKQSPHSRSKPCSLRVLLLKKRFETAKLHCTEGNPYYVVPSRSTTYSSPVMATKQEPQACGDEPSGEESDPVFPGSYDSTTSYEATRKSHELSQSPSIMDFFYSIKSLWKHPYEECHKESLS